jgi:hypothetical protein
VHGGDGLFCWSKGDSWMATTLSREDLDFIATYLVAKIDEVCEKKYKEIEQRNHKDNKIAMLECPANKFITAAFPTMEDMSEFAILTSEIKMHLNGHKRFMRFLFTIGGAFVTCLIGNIVTLIILYVKSKALGQLP